MSVNTNEIENALFAVGLSNLRNNPVYATPGASQVLSKLQTVRKGKSGEFDLLSKVRVLALDAEGKVPNAFLLPANTLLICFAHEVPNMASRWTFSLSSELDPDYEEALQDTSRPAVLLG